MKKSRRYIAILAFLFVIGMFCGCDIAATDSQAKQSTYPQGDPDVAVEKYNQLLLEWAFDKNFPNDTHANFPEFYGGAYIGEHGNLVILLTKHDDETVNYFSDLIGLDNVVFESVQNSYKSLIAASESAVATMEKVNTEYFGSVSSVGVSVPDNAINVYLNRNVIEEHSLDVQRICSALTDYPNVRVIEVAGYDEPA